MKTQKIGMGLLVVLIAAMTACASAPTPVPPTATPAPTALPAPTQAALNPIGIASPTPAFDPTCGTDTDDTIKNWKEWAKVSEKPISSAGHGGMVSIYVDERAKDKYLSASSPFPICAKIAKARLTGSDYSLVSSVFVMVKMPAGYDPEHGDWWYAMFDSTGSVSRQTGKLEACITCHKQAADADYVFAKTVLESLK